MPKYTVLNGKHWVNEHGTLTAYAKGQTVELPEEVAASFHGRFALVAPAVVAEEKPKGKTAGKPAASADE